MRNKSKSLLIALLASISAFGQIYKSNEKQGIVHFFSATSMENIEAKMETATSILNTATDSVLVRINITSFQFANALMQEHFNENYMESEKFPKADFRGKINEKIDYSKEGENQVTCTGNLTMHGVKKLYTIKGNLIVKGNEVEIVSKFDTKLADHNIEIPKILTKQIAESIAIDLDIKYIPFVRK